MAMDDLRMFVCFEHEFHRRAAKEGESFAVVMVAVKNATVEEISIQMWLNEETFQAVHPTKVHVAMDPVLVIGNPQIAVAFYQAPDPVITHAVVLGENDLHRVTANLQFFG